MKQTDFKDDFNMLRVIVRITAIGILACMGIALLILAVLP